MKNGCVYWITGLSGAGKTTVGKLLYEKIISCKNNVVFLDGDVLRDIFGNDLSYSIEDRRKSAMRNARLCRFLSGQGIDVVCCTISMFHEVRGWNRENIAEYCEIYLKVPLDILKSRDQKGLYSSLEKGLKKNIWGLDLEFEEPENPDITIMNDGSSAPREIVDGLMSRIIG